MIAVSEWREKALTFHLLHKSTQESTQNVICGNYVKINQILCKGGW